ncbi:hypothetical protein SAMN05216480_10352 [Pustulibacterium marinum]|uniref:YcxB-like C-terminal domain-containing protein n=1 Tax=Pustulibacterium marinum TaxID=1224947 RepID=A0A1I7G157_9FLAO|nr:YcxB family protein [Pustulibacterium marinum]SFU42198.1 hypothetical protein SAMN05216480_10352 [Pustulibacterium marinum]
MKLQYQLNEQDLIQYQFYVTSQSKRERRKRQRRKFMLPIMYLGMAIYAYASGDITVGISMATIGLLWLLIYPLYSKRLYTRYYKRYVKENYTNKIGKPATVEVTKEAIFTSDEGSNATVKLTELDSFVAIPEYYIIHLAPNQGIVVPKYTVKDQDAFEAYFTAANVPFKNLSDWKWK